MDARRFTVPRQRDVARLTAAQREPLTVGGQLDDALRAAVVDVQEERAPEALGFDAGLELHGRDAMQRTGQLHRTAL